MFGQVRGFDGGSVTSVGGDLRPIGICAGKLRFGTWS